MGIQTYPNRSNLFLVSPDQGEENLPSFLHSQTHPCHGHWWTQQFQGARLGKQERKGPGAASLSGAAVESRPFAQKMPSTSRTEVLGGVVHHSAKVLGEEWVGESTAPGQWPNSNGDCPHCSPSHPHS